MRWKLLFVTLQGVNLKLVRIVEDADKIIQKQVFGFELKDISQIGLMKPDAILITSFRGQGEKVE